MILESAAVRWVGKVTVLVAMGDTYPFDVTEGAAERVRWYHAAAVAAPTNSSAWPLLGIAYRDRKDYGNAEAALREAVRLDNTYAAAYGDLATVVSEKGDLDGALAAAREAVRLAPKVPQAHSALGNALLRTGDVDGAIAAFGEAARLDPNLARAHYFLGLSLAERGRFAEALPALRRGHDLGSKQPGWTFQSARIVAQCQRELAKQEARTAPPPREVKR